MQRFSQSLQEFQFECIGDAETDDEISIGEWKRLTKKNLINVPTFYNIFYSSVLKRVLPVVEHHGGGEETTGKNTACVCVHSHSQRLNVR